MSLRKENSRNVRYLAARTAYDRPHLRQRENGDEHRFRFCATTAQTHAATHVREAYWDVFAEARDAAINNGDDEATAAVAGQTAAQAAADADPAYRPLAVKGKAAYVVSFTKGLPHDPVTGLVNNPAHFQLFVRAIDSGDSRDFRDTPLGSARNCNGAFHVPMWQSEFAKGIGKLSVRAWESQSAGLSYDLQGPDAQAVVMPPAPSLGSAELTAEMAEVYVQALLRDVPFQNFTAGVTGLDADDDDVSDDDALLIIGADENEVNRIFKYTSVLADLPWFNGGELENEKISSEAATRRRTKLTPGSAFRGITRGDDVGPYLSQFLLVGDEGFAGERAATDGTMNYGSIGISHKTRVATTGKNYLTSWKEWLDAQNAADLRGHETYESPDFRRFIHTPRDLATYVHFDALYEAYLNACISLLNAGTPFDPGIPFQEADNVDHQQGFAHFGGPHILSLVTEVATRALKAVRFQKYNVHRRCRPEVLAARIEKAEVLQDVAPELVEMKNAMDSGPDSILGAISTLNEASNNGKAGETGGTYLLPMAFTEGSPMHPAYGAGHATVAGACVTILKAFFDHAHPLTVLKVADGDTVKTAAGNAGTIDTLPEVFRNQANQSLKAENFAYVSANGGEELQLVPVLDKNGHLASLTVEGELNKLASNIAIGRNWAGVHYFTDYYESLLMGEEIAIAILEEQKLTFGENFSITVPKFNGESYRI
ncbi:MAG: vanadium-dependent haloperoxidase [Lewinella sp.]